MSPAMARLLGREGGASDIVWGCFCRQMVSDSNTFSRNSAIESNVVTTNFCLRSSMRFSSRFV